MKGFSAIHVLWTLTLCSEHMIEFVWQDLSISDAKCVDSLSIDVHDQSTAADREGDRGREIKGASPLTDFDFDFFSAHKKNLTTAKKSKSV